MTTLTIHHTIQDHTTGQPIAILPEENPLLTFREALALLKVSRSTLYRLMWSGQLQSHKVGATYRFYRNDLLALVQPQTYHNVSNMS